VSLRYLSVCSGIEAATVAWHPLGWTPAAFSEIEPFPRAVLAHHYPDVPCHGDFTTIEADQYGPIDLLVGGTPCQSFSIAGLRGGLADDRGNLALEFLRLADRTRPRWLVWENVPGVLSIDEGWAFGSILGGMGELGYGSAYRVLDAQHFGVPQRRRRVFVVGCLGDWRSAAAVLFERHSLSGHPAPRREAGQVAPTIPSRSLGGGGLGTDFDCDGGLIQQAFGGNNTAGAIDVATALSSHGGPHGRLDFESETFIAHSPRGEGFDASEDGTGRGTPLVPVHAIQAGALRENPSSGPDGIGVQLDCAYTLEARQEVQAVAFDCKASGQNGFGVGEVMSTLRSMGHKDSHNNGGEHASVQYGSAVRRLTPRECERLQGFPDDYTAVPYRNKPAADGPRYKALGNSMAVPVMRWIGERIAAVDALCLTEAEAA